jgi:hypothetical protein
VRFLDGRLVFVGAAPSQGKRARSDHLPSPRPLEYNRGTGRSTVAARLSFDPRYWESRPGSRHRCLDAGNKRRKHHREDFVQSPGLAAGTTSSSIKVNDCQEEEVVGKEEDVSRPRSKFRCCRGPQLPAITHQTWQTEADEFTEWVLNVPSIQIARMVEITTYRSIRRLSIRC